MPTALAKPWPGAWWFRCHLCVAFRVTRGARSELAEIPAIVDRDRVTRQVQQRVQQHRAVAPFESTKRSRFHHFGLPGLCLSTSAPQHLGNVRHAHGSTRMSRVRSLDCVHRDRADGVGQRAPAQSGVGGIHKRARIVRYRWVGATLNPEKTAQLARVPEDNSPDATRSECFRCVDVSAHPHGIGSNTCCCYTSQRKADRWFTGAGSGNPEHPVRARRNDEDGISRLMSRFGVALSGIWAAEHVYPSQPPLRGDGIIAVFAPNGAPRSPPRSRRAREIPLVQLRRGDEAWSPTRMRKGSRRPANTSPGGRRPCASCSSLIRLVPQTTHLSESSGVETERSAGSPTTLPEFLVQVPGRYARERGARGLASRSVREHVRNVYLWR